MGKLIYVPDVMDKAETKVLIDELSRLVAKVDHFVARSVLNDAISELKNEVDNIESGHRVNT